MKQILIVNNNMHIGGVQKSLVNLLHNLPDDYQVTLLLFSPRGALMEDIPERVRVISPRSGYACFGMTRNDPLTLREKLCRGFYAGITRTLGRKWAVALMAPFQKTLEGFDVAVSFLHSGKEKSFYGGCNEFVLKHVKAKKKISFLHCDFGEIGGNTRNNRKLYQKFDAIAACSEGCRQAFVRQIPELEDRVAVVENCCDFDAVRKAAQREPVVFPKGKLHVVTVARLGREKAVDRGVLAIGALGGLRDRVHYHIIGSGMEEVKIRRTIAEQGMEQSVTLYGDRKNPYGFIKAADLLLIPSVSEAAPMVIREAAVLETPILSTRTSSAEDMVGKTGFGWVCDNSVEAMTQALRGILENPQMRKEKETFLRTCCHSNEGAIGQFCRIAEVTEKD